MALLLSRLGAFSHRHRAAVVLVWLVLLVGGGVGAVTLAGETSDSFSIPGQESTTALERISEEFGAAGGATAQVVVVAPDGQTLTTPESAGAVGALAALAVLTLAAHAQDQTTAWRQHIVATCFDALGHRRPDAAPAHPDQVEA